MPTHLTQGDSKAIAGMRNTVRPPVAAPDTEPYSGAEAPMKQSLKSSELKQLSPEAQDDAMRRLARVAKSAPNGELKDLDAQIFALEEQHGITSAQLRTELAQGLRKETWEICQWLMLLDQRGLLGARKARSS